LLHGKHRIYGRELPVTRPGAVPPADHPQAEVEAGIWENGPIVAAGRQHFVPTGILESNRETSRPLASERGMEATAMLYSSEQNSPPPGSFQPQLFTHILIVEIYPLRPPLRLQGVPLQSNSPPDSIPPPLAGQSPISNTPDENHANPPIIQPTNQSTNQPTLPVRVIQPVRFAAIQNVPYTIEAGDVGG